MYFELSVGEAHKQASEAPIQRIGGNPPPENFEITKLANFTFIPIEFCLFLA